MNISPQRASDRRNSEALQNVQTAYNVPWGLSDEKPERSSIIVDTLSNLAGNIQRFEIKRRLVRNVSRHKRQPKTNRSNTDRNSRGDSEHRMMVDDCRRRIQHYQSCQKTALKEAANEYAPAEKKNTEAGNERKSAQLKSIEVKFGTVKNRKHNRSTSENIPTNIGDKFLSNIRARILSRKQSMRQAAQGLGNEPGTGRSQSRQLRELHDVGNKIPLEEQLGFLNVNKLMPHSLKSCQARKLKIFDLEEFMMRSKPDNRAECSPQFSDLVYEVEARPLKLSTGCSTDRTIRPTLLLPR